MDVKGLAMFRALKERFVAMVGIGIIVSTIGLGLSILRNSESVRDSVSVALTPLSVAPPLEWQGEREICADCENVELSLGLRAIANALLGLFLASPLFGVAALVLERARRRRPAAARMGGAYLPRALLVAQAGGLGAIALMFLAFVTYAGGVDSLEKVAGLSAMALAFAAWGLPSILGIRAVLVLLAREQQPTIPPTLRSTQVGSVVHAGRR